MNFHLMQTIVRLALHLIPIIHLVSVQKGVDTTRLEVPRMTFLSDNRVSLLVDENLGNHVVELEDLRMTRRLREHLLPILPVCRARVYLRLCRVG